MGTPFKATPVLRQSLAVISTALFLASCSDFGDQPLAVRTVEVRGSITLYHEDPTWRRIGAGARIAVEGTEYTTIANTSGYWTLQGVPAGVYTLTASLAGYVSTTLVGLDFRNDSTFYYSLTIGEQPMFNVTNITANPTTDLITVSGTLSNTAPHRRWVVVYFDTTSSVSNLRFKAAASTNNVQPSSSTFTLSDSVRPLRHLGFVASGQRVYMAAYGTCGGSVLYDIPSVTSYYLDVSPIPARGSFIMP